MSIEGHPRTDKDCSRTQGRKSEERKVALEKGWEIKAHVRRVGALQMCTIWMPSHTNFP